MKVYMTKEEFCSYNNFFLTKMGGGVVLCLTVLDKEKYEDGR